MTAIGALRTLFARSRVFSALEESSFQQLVAVLKHERVRADARLFRQGEPGDSLAVIVEGRFRIDVVRSGGQCIAMGRVGPGDVIGEMSCIDPAPRSATVTAMEAGEVMLLDRGTLSTLQRHAPDIFSAIVGGVIARTTERLRETNGRVEQALSLLGVAPTLPKMPRIPTGEARAARDADDLARLRRLSGLKGFNEAELQTLVKVAPERRFEPGDALLEEGGPGGSCFVLVEGAVEVVRTIEGRERRLAVLPEGTIVGQIALVDDCTRQATVRALDAVHALELSRHNFERLLAARAPLAIRFQEQVALATIRQLRLANQRFAGVLDRVEQIEAERRQAEIEAQEERRRAEAGQRFQEGREAALDEEFMDAPDPDPDHEGGDPTWDPDAPPETRAFDVQVPESGSFDLSPKDLDWANLDAPGAPPPPRAVRRPPPSKRAGDQEAPTPAASAPPRPEPARTPPRSRPDTPPPRASIPTEVFSLGESPGEVEEMAFLQAALEEWGIRAEDLDRMKTKVPEGVVTAQEIKLRGKR